MINLEQYSGKRICVAVSGGRDSMALLHYFYGNAEKFGIKLSAVNCDHKIRGESSLSDSRFVAGFCRERSIPLKFFEWNGDAVKTENSARIWRRECYRTALKPDSDGGWDGADMIATAHHMGDNAETVLFNLARGSALAGMTGITDCESESGLKIVRPFIGISRSRIEEYVKENSVPYVDDETNFTDAYTRNKIRHNVLPELYKAVPGAERAIFRFSRLAAEDERYFEDLIENRGIIKNTPFGVEISLCEPAVFKRAAVKAVAGIFKRKDYTSLHAESLFNLTRCAVGKKFEFLSLVAYREENAVGIAEKNGLEGYCIPYNEYSGCDFCGRLLKFSPSPSQGKTLKFDAAKIPAGAVIRFMRNGDVFKKFGGGTKNLGDFFTDRKIPARIRKQLPLIADGNEVYLVAGIEISDKIKVTKDTKNVLYAESDKI